VREYRQAIDRSGTRIGFCVLMAAYFQMLYEFVIGLEDTMKLVEALEGLEMKEGDDFPQGDKVIRKEDHQAFIDEFIFAIKGGKHTIVETVPGSKTVFPPACKFA